MFKTILSNFHLEKIFWTLKKKALYIFLSTAVLGMVAGAYASITSTSLYMAQISFYVYSNPDYITDSSVNIGSSDITQAKNLITSYMQILKSRTFLEKVKEETGLGYSTDYLKSQISASAIENTAAFVVRVVDQNPVNAMDIANAIGELAPNEIIRIVKSGGRASNGTLPVHQCVEICNIGCGSRFPSGCRMVPATKYAGYYRPPEI